MAYLPPTRSLNFLVHGSRAYTNVSIPPHIEIVLFTEHDEALTGGQATLVFSWLRKNYEQGAANVLLQPVFIKTPQRRYRIGRQFEGPIVPFQAKDNSIAAAFAEAAASVPPGVSPWGFYPVGSRQGGGKQRGGGQMKLTGLSALIVGSPSGGAAGGGGAGGGGGTLVTTGMPSQPQVPLDESEFSVTLSVYSHTALRNLCPNLFFSFEDDFQVNPMFPTSTLGIYNTDAAKLYYFKDTQPSSRSGRDLDFTRQIYARYGLGRFDLNMLLNDFFPPPAGGARQEKTRIYLCCCSGLITAPPIPGSVLHQGNIPGVPSSPLVENMSNRGAELKRIHQGIKVYKNTAASGNAEAHKAAHTNLSHMIGLH